MNVFSLWFVFEYHFLLCNQWHQLMQNTYGLIMRFQCIFLIFYAYLKQEMLSGTITFAVDASKVLSESIGELQVDQGRSHVHA